MLGFLKSGKAKIVRRARRAIGLPKSQRRRLLDRMPRGGVCAEIGVWKGDFSDHILRYANPKSLHLIDPWLFQPQFPERMYGGGIAKNQDDMDCIFQGVRERFAGEPRVLIHKGTSADILPAFPNGYFDWVYIDGNHSYEFVLADLRMCMAKTKPGGSIAGDDYNWGAGDGYPVRRAVLDFAAQNSIKRRLTVLDSQFIIKVPG